MAKPGRCVHCLQHVDAITDDHLFPRSWYPETTPANLEKWKIPSCGKCNGDYGRIEQGLLIALAACGDPRAAGSAGIWKRALRAFDEARAKSPADALKRKLAKGRFLRRLMPAPKADVEGQLPEIHPDRPKGEHALLVPANDLHRFIEKLVRGTVYLTEQRYVDENQEVTVAIIDKNDETELLNVLGLGELFERGPGIRIRKVAAQDAKANAMFVFDVWDQFRFYGAVMDRDA